MKSSLLICPVLWCLAGGVTLAGDAGARIAATDTRLYVDGADAGAALRWEGGDLRAKAVAATASGGAVMKLPGSPALAPLVVHVAFPPPTPLAAWISEVAAGGAPQRTVMLVEIDTMRGPVEAYEVSDAMLTEIVFPAFDATNRTFDPMRLVFTGSRGRAVTAPAGSVALAPRSGIAGFQLMLAGLDGAGVSRIEAITIRQSVSANSVGDDFIVKRSAGPTEISNLVVTLSRGTLPTWRSWHTDYVVNAAGPGAKKRDGSIALLDPTGRPGPISLALTGCGILSLSRPPDVAGVPAKYIAEMFIERIAFAGLPPPVAGPKPAVESEPPPPKKAEPTAGAASPADKGMRDPAEFPRVPDLVRTSYSGNFDKTYTSEQANYTAKETANQLLARVSDAAKRENWELRTLDETESAASRQIHQRWVRDKANVTLTISEQKEVNGSQLLLQVYVTIPPK